MFHLRQLTVVLALSSLVACGDSELEPAGGADDINFQAGQGDLSSGPAVTDVTQVVDTGPAPTDTGGADDEVQTTPVDVVFDTQFQDLVPDLEGPTLVSSAPAAGQAGVDTPFVVTLTFSEPLFEPTATTSVTLKIRDVNGIELAGAYALSEDGTVLTFTPADGTVFYRASPYSVWLGGGVLKDLAGNAFIGETLFTFYTENFEDPGDQRRNLAIAYAPIIHSETSDDGKAHTQVPTKLDLDGDWDLSNNWDAVNAADSLIPAVYYSVAETRTHWFIHYLYYFPWVNAGSEQYANGMSGAMVTVAKNGANTTPVAVTHYFRSKSWDENRTYVTEESGIVPSGVAADDLYIEGLHSQQSLFPDGHYEVQVTHAEHFACAWVDTDDDVVGTLIPDLFCSLSEAKKASMSALTFAYTDGSPTPYQKGDSGWPQTNEQLEGAPATIGYALIPVSSTMWPRRLEVGDGQVYANVYTYQSDAERTAIGDGSVLPRSFIDSIQPNDNNLGQPVWAWEFAPGGTSSAPGGQVRQGEFGIDPAWYIWKRHRNLSEPFGLVEYDEETDSGFALDYCFNLFANINAGAEAGCP